MKKKITPEDIQVWKDFISGDHQIDDKDKNLEKKISLFNKIKKIDLHGFTLEEANKKIKEVVMKSYKGGITKIIVITGKGSRSNNEENPYVSKDLSLLKHSVPDYLKNNEDLIKIIFNISEAKIEDGGKGAFYIFLKKFKE